MLPTCRFLPFAPAAMSAQPPRSRAPITTSDFYDWFATVPDDINTERLKLRQFMSEEWEPQANGFWERADFPREYLVERMKALDLLRGKYTPERAATATISDGLLSMEFARVDPSLATFFGVHAGLCMGAIALCGSEEQQAEWLPPLRRWDMVGAFGLTEPDVGSGVAKGLTTTCRRDGDHWVLNGQKKWIGNSTWCDIVVVWARDEADQSVKGFIVRTSLDGYSAELMTGKIAQRTVHNGLITLNNVRVAERDRLQQARSFADTQRVLVMARCGTAWQGVGCAMGAYEYALRYASERTQFGRPIGSYQLVQNMLVKMLGNITAMIGLALRASELQDRLGPRDELSALAKQFCAARCRETVALARESMGGNGILLEYHVARLFADAEAIYSYEGSNEINTMIVGRAITGHSAFV
ncbi:acyl-CoA dehydrogenase family protein [Gemmatimonas phototrophica]|uniref:acyl-CoA dehydrogenase family protein n=1 Tax=Gemmatimonas phototrophica TaxID=1379270 RepID=UPI0009ECD1E9|nr:acyl-CoA dehydrogenase family protein [Gemmatimonas phototrophica]